MMLKTVLYWLYVLIFEIPQYFCAECTRYYTILEMEPPGFITIKTLNDVLSMGYPFNTTEEYNIIKNNVNCVLEFNCDENTSTECSAPIKMPSLTSKHEFIPSGAVSKYGKIVATSDPTSDTMTPKDPVYDTTTPLAVSKISNTVTPNVELETTETISDTDPAVTPTVYLNVVTTEMSINPDKTETITPTPEDNTSIKPAVNTATEITTQVQQLYSNNTISTTLHPLAFETVDDKTTVSYDAEHLSEMEKEKKDRIRTTALFIGGLAGGSLLILLAKHAVEAVQSGTYRFPDPVVNTAV